MLKSESSNLNRVATAKPRRMFDINFLVHLKKYRHGE